MIVASEFSTLSLDELKALLQGGSLTVYSVARPVSADLAVDRSGVLATFTFASPAFGGDEATLPAFVSNPVSATTVGTPGFARARTSEGVTVADFSAGPGDREIKFAEVSCSQGAPVRIVSFSIKGGEWPERPDFYNSHPRVGSPQPLSA